MAIIEERKGRNGLTVYRAKIRLKGRRPESKTFERKTDARDWAQQREAELKRSRAFGTAETAHKTIADLIDRYLDHELPKRNSNQDMVKTCLKWWRTEIGERTLQDISPSILAECRDRLLQARYSDHKFASKKTPRKKSPATVIRYMAALSHVFSVAANEWEWIDSNPMLKVKKPALPQPRVRFLDDDERKRLIEACRKSDCSYLYPVVVIALSTGARYSEIMHLRWRDIDLERGIARLEKTKNQDRRALPLAHHALELVKALRKKQKDAAKTDYVFARADGLAPMEIRKHWYKAMEDAELEDFRFHDLRHSAASYLAMNGATLAEIAEVLGHKTLQMVKRYAHLSDQHTAKVVERMNKKIFKDQ
tara:strand:+ start:7762 stop:8856 length:1095 start_codon:yes stop_codon:yes gene_type:complete